MTFKRVCTSKSLDNLYIAKNKIYECNENEQYYENEANIVDDYEIINKSHVIATFSGYEQGDFDRYEFTTPLGYKYYFNEFSDYKYSFINDNGDRPNPKYLNKKFKILFHTKTVKNDFNEGNFEMYIVDKIELFEQ